MANMKRSPWLLHYDGSSCNGCDIEVLACLTPVYDVERFGVVNTGDPMQADIFLITGGINTQNQAVVRGCDLGFQNGAAVNDIDVPFLWQSL